MDEVRGEVALRGGGEEECVEEKGCALPLSHKVPPPLHQAAVCLAQ